MRHLHAAAWVPPHRGLGLLLTSTPTVFFVFSVRKTKRPPSEHA